MSDTENREFEVRWRTFLSGKESVDSRTFMAAFFQRDKDLLVFKRVGGAPVFTVAEGLLETIDIKDAPALATGGPVSAAESYVVDDGPREFEMRPGEHVSDVGGNVTINVSGSAATDADLVETVRRQMLQYRGRGPGTGAGPVAC